MPTILSIQCITGNRYALCFLLQMNWSNFCATLNKALQEKNNEKKNKRKQNRYWQYHTCQITTCDHENTTLHNFLESKFIPGPIKGNLTCATDMRLWCSKYVALCCWAVLKNQRSADLVEQLSKKCSVYDKSTKLGVILAWFILFYIR